MNYQDQRKRENKMELTRKTILEDEDYLRQISIPVDFNDEKLSEEIEALKDYSKYYSSIFKLIKYMEDRYNPYTGEQTIKEKFEMVGIKFLTEQNYQNFFMMTWVIIKEALRSALRQMEDKDLIVITRCLRLFRQESMWIEDEGEMKKIK